MRKMTDIEFFQARVLIDYWQELFPYTFPKKPFPKKALELGISKRLLPFSVHVDATEKTVSNALYLWCRGKRYYKALSKPSAKRVDLFGLNCGSVSLNEALCASRKLLNGGNKYKH